MVKRPVHMNYFDAQHEVYMILLIYVNFNKLISLVENKIIKWYSNLYIPYFFQQLLFPTKNFVIFARRGYLHIGYS